MTSILDLIPKSGSNIANNGGVKFANSLQSAKTGTLSNNIQTNNANILPSSSKREIFDNHANQKQNAYYTVKKGDSLSKIAQRELGSINRLPELLRANPQIKNPDLIRIGEKIKLPLNNNNRPILPSFASNQTVTKRSTYIVKSGDSLSKIAKRELGGLDKLPELLRVNPQIKNPDLILVGQKINLPTSKVSVTSPALPMSPNMTDDAHFDQRVGFGATQIESVKNAETKKPSQQSKNTNLKLDVHYEKHSWKENPTMNYSVSSSTNIGNGMKFVTNSGVWDFPDKKNIAHSSLGLRWSDPADEVKLGADVRVKQGSDELRYTGSLAISPKDSGLTFSTTANTDGRQVSELTYKPSSDVKFGAKYALNDFDTPNKKEERLYGEKTFRTASGLNLSLQGGMLDTENDNFPYAKIGASYNLDKNTKIYARAENKSADDVYVRFGFDYKF